MPEQGIYVYHTQFPRFRAKFENGGLVIDEEIDGPNIDYSGKLARAEKWFFSVKAKLPK